MIKRKKRGGNPARHPVVQGQDLQGKSSTVLALSIGIGGHLAMPPLLLHVPARGFTPARHRQGQLKLVWRSRFGHETPDLLALSFNPFSGTVRAFG
jgi:hypothetical protein